MKTAHTIAMLAIVCFILYLPLCASAQNQVLSLNEDAGTATISGTCLMLDDKTPHVALVVQAVQIPAHPQQSSRRYRDIVTWHLDDQGK